MPWIVRRDDRCSSAKPWAVIKETDGSVVACHASKEKATAQQKALYANEPGANAMPERAEGMIGGMPIHDLPRSSFAYCEPDDGPCHFPIRDKNGNADAAHVRNALARLSQSPFAAKARPAVEKAAKELGIGGRAQRWGEDGGLYVGDIEFRAAKDGGQPQLTAYAALWNTPSDAPWLGYVETIQEGAFSESLRAKGNHELVVNHNDDLLLASTRTGRLRLSEDKRGLLVNADLPDTSTARDLKALYDVGEVRGMSFAFKPTRGGVRHTETGRELTNVRLGHVTVITSLTPGYSATAPTIYIRALAEDIFADPDDIEDLFDAIRAGRPLIPDEADLLDRLATHYRPVTPDEEPADKAGIDWQQSRALLDRLNAEWSAAKTILPPKEPGATPGAA